ncbi:hypothetical protein VTJ04DRAFT_2281 [Mycothermus thermophilus]|uniref:uncharacterized protein n=1 Tax=Humicola insolens TaxID=85995 RepID=UPI0037449FA0
MDGSYGNVFPAGRGMPVNPNPQPPAAPGNMYKININRQKTKKWANFKPANYDGDDWGADDDDDLDNAPRDPAPAPAPAPPPKPLGPRSQPVAPATGSNSPTTRLPHSATLPVHPIDTSSPRSNHPPGHSNPQSPVGRRGPVAQLPSQQKPPTPANMPAQPGQPVPLPRPGDIVKPWVDTTNRSGSASPRSSSPLASPGKRFPLVRPADVYQRLEQERERERRSSESGRSGGGGRTPEPVRSPVAPAPPAYPAPPAHPAPPAPSTQPRAVPPPQPTGFTTLPQAPSPAPAPATGPALGPSTGPTPTDERKSEYGFDRLIASYATDRTSSTDTYVIMREKVHAAAPAPDRDPPSSPQNIRRFSSSPQLPEVTRLSGFGEDLFSTGLFSSSGSFSAPDRDLADIPESSSATAASSSGPGQSLTSSGAAPVGASSSDTASKVEMSRNNTPQPSASNVAAPPPKPEQPDPVAVSSIGPAHTEGGGLGQTRVDGSRQPSPAVDQNAADAGRVPASSPGEVPAGARPNLRPQMPGGWVSETPSTPGPAEVPVKSGAGDVSRESGDKQEAPGPGSPVSVSESLLEVAASTVFASSPPDKPAVAPAALQPPAQPSQPVSPLASPAPSALRTSSPAPSAKSAASMGSQSKQQPPAGASQGRDPSPAPTSHVAETNGPAPASATTDKSDNNIPPTAPLNPHRPAATDTKETLTLATPSQGVPSSKPSPTEQSPPPSAAPSHSPVNPNDALSEEILRSLEPTAAHAAPSSTLETQYTSTDAARESSYLGDVYGDYWSSTDDKLETGLLTLETGLLSLDKLGDVDKDKDYQPSLLPIVPVDSTAAAAAATHQPVNDSTTATQSSSENQRQAPPTIGIPTRFSWETAPEPVLLQPQKMEVVGEQKPVESNAPGPVELDATEPASRVSERGPDKSAEDLRSTPVTQTLYSATITKPAPAVGSSAAPAVSAESLPRPIDQASTAPEVVPSPRSTEEKIVLPGSDEKIPLSPSDQRTPSPHPPPQHPAQPSQQPPPPPQQLQLFQQQPQPVTISKPASPSPPAPPAVSAQNILPFRTIMEMPLASERIRHFSESRLQFAAIDSGLNEWLRVTLARYPEHGEPETAGGPSTLALPPAGTTPLTSPTGISGAGASSSSGPFHHHHHHHHVHMPSSLQQGLSGLGHSGGQVGTKSKELLMAAGKAGKGLFSKGKSKLRGTGEKVFSSS